MAEQLAESTEADPAEVLSNGIEWMTGQPLPPITWSDAELPTPAPDGVTARGNSTDAYNLAISDIESNDLGQAGWGVIFTRDVPDTVKTALEPLLERRKSQAQKLFRIFEKDDAPGPTESVRQWLERKQVGFASVDPLNGVPLYLLIVGSPVSLSYEFQYLLDTYWNVGRLYFDYPADYGLYADHVVAYETASSVPHKKRLALYATSNGGDRATALFCKQVARPMTEGPRRLGEAQGFQLRTSLGYSATKVELSKILHGQIPDGTPALLVTGSHGAYVPMKDGVPPQPKDQSRIGALVTQDWPGIGTPLEDRYCFAHSDLQHQAKLNGMIQFAFACYSGGCPQFDTYKRPRKQLAPTHLVSRYPQQMLKQGALAFIGHVDRAFSTSFQTSRGQPQAQDIRDILVNILKGNRVGQAMDTFNLRWCVLSAELGNLLRDRESDPSSVSTARLVQHWQARDDARNYAIFGDPAVRLRVEAMGE